MLDMFEQESGISLEYIQSLSQQAQCWATTMTYIYTKKPFWEGLCFWMSNLSCMLHRRKALLYPWCLKSHPFLEGEFCFLPTNPRWMPFHAETTSDDLTDRTSDYLMSMTLFPSHEEMNKKRKRNQCNFCFQSLIVAFLLCGFRLWTLALANEKF